MRASKKRKKNKQAVRSSGDQQNTHISVCMIVKNEANKLEECLRLVRGFADEIVLVDTGSEDQTTHIARKYGARVFHFTWSDDFSAARNESLKHASGKWIIWIDADDRIFPDQHQKIRSLAKGSPGRAFNFLLQNDGIDKSQCYQLRMFPNRPDFRFERPVHEQVATSIARAGLPIESTDVILIHTGYYSEDVVRKKKKRYLAMMEKWLVEKPDDSAIRYQYALALHTLKENEEACEEFKFLVDHFPEASRNDPVYYYSLILMGRSLLDLGRLDESLATLRLAEEIDDSTSFVRISMAEVFIQQKDYESAIKYLNSAADGPEQQMSFFPIDFRVLRYGRLSLLGKANLELEYFEEAEKYLKQATDFLPEKPDAYRFYAEWNRKLGKYKEALDCYQHASDRDRKNFRYDFDIGELYLGLGWLKRAGTFFERALKKSVDHPAIILKLAIIEIGCGRYDGAILYFERLMAGGMQDEQTNTHYAFCLLCMGDIGALAKKLPLMPQNEKKQWFGYLLDLFFDKKHSFEANFFSNHPEVSGKPKSEIASYLKELARKSRSETKLDLAELELRVSIFFCEDEIADNLIELANVQTENNRHFQAIGTFEQSLKFCKSSPELTEILRKMGDCYLRIGVDQAYQICNQKVKELESRGISAFQN
jgi:glycosyltransferase involved in cell wall biosynthesis